MKPFLRFLAFSFVFAIVIRLSFDPMLRLRKYTSQEILTEATNSAVIVSVTSERTFWDKQWAYIEFESGRKGFVDWNQDTISTLNQIRNLKVLITCSVFPTLEFYLTGFTLLLSFYLSRKPQLRKSD